MTPGGACDLLALGIAAEPTDQQPVKLIQQRYLISAQPSHISAAVAAKTPASYRHLVDLTASICAAWTSSPGSSSSAVL